MAWRNIWRNTTRSLVVIGAVAIGIWAAISLSGFAAGMMKSYINNSVQHIISHIQVHHPGFLEEYDVEYALRDAPAVEQLIRSEPGVKAVSVRSLSSAMISSAKGARGVRVKGIVPGDEARVNALDEKIREGEYLSDEMKNPLLISTDLAEKLNVKLRSKVVLTFQDMEGEITAAAFRIAGLFDTGNNPFDEAHVFVRRDDLNRLLEPANSSSYDIPPGALAHEIALMAGDVRQVDAIAESLQKKLPGLDVQTYRQLSPDLELYEGQMTTVSIIYLAIIMLALVFGIINTMLMAVLERIKELGMLMAIGMNKVRIFSMIVMETVLLSLAGAPLGLLLGGLTIHYFKVKGLDLSAFAKSLNQYGMGTDIRFDADPGVYWQTAIMLVVTAFLASLYPAWKAIRLKPVEAIRKL